MTNQTSELAFRFLMEPGLRATGEQSGAMAAYIVRLEQALQHYSHFHPAEMGNLSQPAIDALSFDPLA